MIASARRGHEFWNVFKGLAGKKGEKKIHIFKVLVRLDSDENEGNLQISHGYVQRKIALPFDVMIIKKGISEWAWPVKQYIPFFMQNTQAQRFEDVETHFKVLMYRAQHRRGVFSGRHMVGMPIAGIIGLVGQGIQMVANGWKSIADAFKTIKRSTIKSTIEGKGFAKYKQSSTFSRNVGIKDQYYQKYIDSLPRRVTIAQKNKKVLEETLEDLTYMDDTRWKDDQFDFDKDKGGSLVSNAILGNHQSSEGKYNFMLLDISASFGLAPDTMIIEDYLSVAGGIFEKQKDKCKKVARSLTEEDIKAVQSFMYILSFKGFADELGLTTKLPDGF